MILGDTKQLFQESLYEGKEMSCTNRELLVLKDSFIGCDVVKSLMTGTVDAATAAEGFNIITAEMTQTKEQ